MLLKMTKTMCHDIVMIIDESGSMSMVENEVIEAINNFIQNQKNTLEDNSTFSLWKFNNKITHLVDDIVLKDVKTFREFTPHGTTALMDAIGKAIDKKKTKKNHDNVICVILTDGLENSSCSYSRANILSMIREMETYHNWKFIYLGANQDAFAVGSNYGISPARCVSFDLSPEQIDKTLLETSKAVSNFRCMSVYDSHINLELNTVPCSISFPLPVPICRTESLTKQVKIKRAITICEDFGM